MHTYTYININCKRAHFPKYISRNTSSTSMGQDTPEKNALYSPLSEYCKNSDEFLKSKTNTTKAANSSGQALWPTLLSCL